MPKFLIVLAFTGLFAIAAFSQKEMNNVKMDSILHQIGEKVEGKLGNWQLIYGDRVLFIITDQTYNRMRIFTPIIEQKDLEKGELEAMLEANFHAALDAKYALYADFVVSLFTHPLQELTAHQFKDAVKQVAVAAQNFGTTYSSTDFIFGGDTEEGDNKTKDKKINQKPKKT